MRQTAVSASGAAPARAALSLLLLALAIIVIRYAWLSDDAFITLRTVDNLWHGYGLRWNVIERVQSYTHPLWMLLLAAAYGVTREPYFTTLAVSALCLVATATLIARRLPIAQSGLACVLFATSRAFVDFSTSGLENPLSHLLLAAFCLVLLRDGRRDGARPAAARGDDRRGAAPGGEARRGARADDDDGARARFRALAWIAVLCALTRLDLAFLVAPAIAIEAWRLGPRRALPTAGVAALPLVAWHAFTLVYYGNLVPNTALAKLNTGIATPELVTQGLWYLRESLRYDFVTLPTIAIALVLTVWRGFRRTATEERACALAAGILLSLVYIVWIGGDFMSGRFLTPPFVVGVLLLARHVRATRMAVAAGAAAVIAGYASPHATLSIWIAEEQYAWNMALDDPRTHGIVDERRVFNWSNGLLRVLDGRGGVTQHPWAKNGLVWSGRPQLKVVRAIGMTGFFAGPAVHIIDPLALGDAFLARLPLAPGQRWTIGHFTRTLPAGYEASMQGCLRAIYPDGAFAASRAGAGTCAAPAAIDTINQVEEPRLRALFADVVRVTQAPLFAAGRWRAIARANGWMGN